MRSGGARTQRSCREEQGGGMKEHQRIWRTVAIVGALALVAGACGPTPPAEVQPGATATPAEQVQKGGRVIEGTFSDIRTINPILVQDTPSDRVADLIYDGSGLLDVDPQNGEPKQTGLGKYSISSDGLTYTFEIQAAANWSDGKPVIAQDWYVAKKLVAKSKVTVRKSLFQDIKGWQDYVDGKATEISGVALDTANPKKFSVTLAKASCPALLNLSNYVLPEHVWGKYATPTSADAVDKAPENTSPQVVIGPFRFKEWRQGDQVILTRLDTYWKGAPNVDEFVYKVVADATVLAAQLKTGELNIGTIEPKDLADMERQENLKVTKYKNLGYTYIGWRTNDPANLPYLADKRIRQALAYGLDMDAVTKSVLFGEGFKQVSHHVPVQWAYPDPKVLNQYPYDKAKAEDLIKSAGYTKGADGFYAKDGKKISFTIRTNAGNKTRETLAQIASEQYKAIGVEAKTNFEAFQGLVTQLTEGHPSVQAVIIGWALGTEPDPYSIWHSSQIPDPATKKTGFGFTGFKSADVDKAIEEGRNPANGDCSIASRKKHYETMNKVLNEEQPYNFGFGNNVLWITQKNLQNFNPGSFGQLYNIHEWWFKK
jgi:peptide/nickel transport system substrate-binding protein